MLGSQVNKVTDTCVLTLFVFNEKVYFTLQKSILFEGRGERLHVKANKNEQPDIMGCRHLGRLQK